MRLVNVWPSETRADRANFANPIVRDNWLIELGKSQDIVTVYQALR